MRFRDYKYERICAETKPIQNYHEEKYSGRGLVVIETMTEHAGDVYARINMEIV